MWGKFLYCKLLQILVSFSYLFMVLWFYQNDKADMNAPHTPPEWAYKQKSWPEKWYTTYCQGPLGLPKNAFGQIWELSFQEIFPPEVANYLEASTDLGLSCKLWQWIRGKILMCFEKKNSKIRPLFPELLMGPMMRNGPVDPDNQQVVNSAKFLLMETH